MNITLTPSQFKIMVDVFGIKLYGLDCWEEHMSDYEFTVLGKEFRATMWHFNGLRAMYLVLQDLEEEIKTEHRINKVPSTFAFLKFILKAYWSQPREISEAKNPRFISHELAGILEKLDYSQDILEVNNHNPFWREPYLSNPIVARVEELKNLFRSFLDFPSPVRDNVNIHDTVKVGQYFYRFWQDGRIGKRNISPTVGGWWSVATTSQIQQDFNPENLPDNCFAIS